MVDQLPPPSSRRLPGPHPGAATPAPSADLELLERTMRERLPDAVGATEEEIAAAEARLGVALSEELKVLVRVVRARSDDFGEGEEYDHEEECRVDSAVGCEFFGLDHLYGTDAEARHAGPAGPAGAPTGAGGTPPDAPVQHLAGSPGWISFGSNGGDDYAVDLAPGPAGHHGQIILVGHEVAVGAELVADSLTDFVLGRRRA